MAVNRLVAGSNPARGANYYNLSRNNKILRITLFLTHTFTPDTDLKAPFYRRDLADDAVRGNILPPTPAFLLRASVRRRMNQSQSL
jgi:hypothetical protein